MAVSVTGPRAVNELGGPVIPGSSYPDYGEIAQGPLLPTSGVAGLVKEDGEIVANIQEKPPCNEHFLWKHISRQLCWICSQNAALVFLKNV